MKHHKMIELFQYWNRLRGRRPAPRRSEVEPADIKQLLADTFILEEDARCNGIFRLAGTRLCAMFGRELKGFVFSSLWTEKDRNLASRLARNAFDDNTVAVLSFDGITQAGRASSYELILLPLAGSGDGPRALGLVASLERAFWIGIDPVVECRVKSVRVVDPEREPMFLTNRPEITVPDLAPHAEMLGSNAAGQASRRVRHLVVLEGGLKD